MVQQLVHLFVSNPSKCAQSLLMYNNHSLNIKQLHAGNNMRINKVTILYYTPPAFN
jgi:hypothetical protein